MSFTKRSAVALFVVLTSIGVAAARSPGQSALDEGTAQYRQGDFRAAAESFRRAVTLDPSLMPAWENLGWAQHRLGRDDEALRIWNTLLKVEPDNVDALNAMGEVYLARSSPREAARAYAQSLASRPEQPAIRLRLGQCYETLGESDKAEAQYAAILVRHPGDAKAVQRLSDIYEAHDRLGDAEALLRQTLARGAEEKDALTKRLARVLGRKGDAAYAKGDWDAARAAYSEAFRWDGSQPRYLANLGWCERRAGQTQAAIDAWTRAIDRGAQDPAPLWRAIGDAARESGQASKAREAYANAARLSPAASGALYALAAMQLEGGETSQAVSTLDDMFKRPDLADADYLRTADLFIREDQLDAGEAFFSKRGAATARSNLAGSALARIESARASAAYRAGDDAAAADHYKRALVHDPACRAALRDYGWVLWRQADWSGVESVWTKFVTAYPEAPEPHELLARLHLNRGRSELAIAEAERAASKAGESRKSITMLLARACLADGKYRRARGITEPLAAQYEDDLAVQTLHGEALWRNLDFPAAAVQWRKVLDLGSDSPRAMHYWLRSLYESGSYDEALAEARKAADGPKPSEPVLRLLAEDATVRGDDDAALDWYGRLTRAWPQRVPYWIALAEIHRRRDEPRAMARELKQGLRSLPGNAQLSLLLADTHRELGKPALALSEYEALGKRLGRNQTVLLGRVHALTDLSRDHEALDLLRSAEAEILPADQKTLEEAAIFEKMGRRADAAALRATLTAADASSVDVPILLYHGLSDHERSLNMPVGAFESQMRLLKDGGYTTLTLSDLDAILAGGRSFPRKPILVTFDDARADSFRFADPVLARYDLKATMFVPTVRIADESAANADWAQLKRLRGSGRWEFESHGDRAHDPIPIDASGAIAEFLVNREWLAEEARLETEDEFAARVDADYARCKSLLEEHLPGNAVLGYAFPFSEMGQLHGGNESDALAVNEASFRAHYKYGFVQDATGYNTLSPASRGPMLLLRFNVPRDWDAARLAAHLATEDAASRARLDAAQWDLWTGRLDRAEKGFDAIVAREPQSAAAVAPYLARTLLEADRPRDAARVLAEAPSGPAWDAPDSFRRKLENDIAWDNDPLAGFRVEAVSDADGRDEREASATGRYAFHAPVDLTARFGTQSFQDAVFPELSGEHLELSVKWRAFTRGAFEGWVRERKLSQGIDTLNGGIGFSGRVDRHRYAVACSVEDVPTVGAFLDGIQTRGCDASYRASDRLWLGSAQGGYRSLTDGNSIAAAYGMATRSLGRKSPFEAGARLELADTSFHSTLYYTPEGLVTALAVVRAFRSFPSGTSIEAELGAGPSRDAVAGSRIVGRAHVAWNQNWTRHIRTGLTADYGQTPDYHRTTLGFSFDYRF